MLEGCDGGGKSTYADALVKTHAFLTEDEPNPPRVVVLHKGQPTPGLDAFAEYELPLEEPDLRQLCHSTRDLVVMDRWHAGEPVYGSLYRGASRLTEAGMLHVEMALDAVGALKMLVQPRSVEVVRQRLLDRGEDFLKPAHVDRVHGWYEAHGAAQDYVRANAIAPSETLKHAATLAVDAHTNDIRTWPGYVGDASPSTLLVGDQRNDGPRARLEFQRAFTPWDSAGSALYLMRALLTVEMRRQVGIINAHEPGMDLSLIHELPYRVNVVALGNHASKALRDVRVTHEKVPHPQWWRRFRHSKVTAYGETIREASRWNW